MAERPAADPVFDYHDRDFFADRVFCEPRGGAGGNGRGVAFAHGRGVAVHRLVSSQKNQFKFGAKQAGGDCRRIAGFGGVAGIFPFGIHDIRLVAGKFAAGAGVAFILSDVGAGGGGLYRVSGAV